MLLSKQDIVYSHAKTIRGRHLLVATILLQLTSKRGPTRILHAALQTSSVKINSFNCHSQPAITRAFTDKAVAEVQLLMKL